MRVLSTLTPPSWNKYWYGSNLLLSASILRIGIGLSLLFIIISYFNISDYSQYFQQVDLQSYRPISVLQVFGSDIPSVSFFQISKIIAEVSSVLFCLGFLTKYSGFTSLFFHLIIFSVQYSWGASPDHGLNAVYLVQFALLFSPSNYFLSIDAVLFKNKNNKWIYFQNNGWGVYLAQFGLTLIFLSAFFFKNFKNPYLSWAFSDSLRNYIIQEYLITLRIPIPAYLQLIIQYEVIYKGLAFFSMICQCLSVFACFAVRKPKVRLFFGLLFLLENIGIGLVVQLWQIVVFPLIVIFIDWENLFPKITPKFKFLESNLISPKRIHFRTSLLFATLSFIFLFHLILLVI